MLLLNQESCLWVETCAWQGVGHGVCISGHLPGGSDLRCWQPYDVCGERREEEEEKTFLFKVEQNGKYNTSEFAITST